MEKNPNHIAWRVSDWSGCGGEHRDSVFPVGRLAGLPHRRLPTLRGEVGQQRGQALPLPQVLEGDQPGAAVEAEHLQVAQLAFVWRITDEM